MERRESWRPVLDAEVARWSAMTTAQLIAELADGKAYEVEFESRKYQVEVELLENTPEYLNVAVFLDDGTLPASIVPVSHNFIRQKDDSRKIDQTRS